MALWRSRHLVAALGVGLAVLALVPSLRTPDVSMLPIVVAARDLPAGASLTSDDVRVVTLPDDGIDWNVPRVPTEVVGATAAVAIDEGTPVVPGLLAPDDVRGPEGTVVTPVRFADPAVAGLLMPGMRVDVLAAVSEAGPGTVVATRALVLPAPASPRGVASTTGLFGGEVSADEALPVLLAVTRDEVDDLTGAAASALLSAVVVP